MSIETNIEIAKLTAKEVLLTLFDIVAAPFFESSTIYKRSMNEYLEERGYERSEFLQKIYYLKKKGYITAFVESKEKFFELTPKGLNRYKKIAIEKITIPKSEKWDKRWRIVIFDIPKKFDYQRDVFRTHIKKLGFIQIQKSVYVFPYECTNEVTELSQRLGVEEFVTIMIAEIFQGEDKLIYEFMSRNVLTQSNIERNTNQISHFSAIAEK